jgi:hypothetical protein
VSGVLNKNIIETFKVTFQDNCLILLIDSYNSAINTGNNFEELDENSITAQLVGFMKKNSLSLDYKIDITREFYLDNDETYLGTKSADTSPRIDIRFMNWTTSDKFEYFIEAKNLYETNWQKVGNKSQVDSTKYAKRYIDTGIQNFIIGKYSCGCLVGYVLRGDPDKIADKINTILSSANRAKEILKKNKNLVINYFFISEHSSLKLNHFFLKFA